MRIRIRAILLILTVCFSYAAVSGSSYESDAVYEGKLDSKLMGREMPYYVYGPVGFSKKGGTKLPVVYLLLPVVWAWKISPRRGKSWWSGWRRVGTATAVTNGLNNISAPTAHPLKPCNWTYSSPSPNNPRLSRPTRFAKPRRSRAA